MENPANVREQTVQARQDSTAAHNSCLDARPFMIVCEGLKVILTY
jgi:hypothetical protein